MDEFRAMCHRSLVSGIEIVGGEPDLHIPSGAVFLCWVDGKVQERPIRPRVRTMRAARPSIVVPVRAALVVVDVEVNSETIPIELDGLQDISRFDHDEN
ncbi:MAG TPA: hypothetical protein VMW08_17065 [Acidimicrobiales bacterium]|nr:hypothetical protein [Acidimicrobiales bacterium]